MDAISFCKIAFSVPSPSHYCGTKTQAYLLVGIHRGKPSVVRGLAALLSDAGNFFLGAVGKVARVGVARHAPIC